MKTDSLSELSQVFSVLFKFGRYKLPKRGSYQEMLKVGDVPFCFPWIFWHVFVTPAHAFIDDGCRFCAKPP